MDLLSEILLSLSMKQVNMADFRLTAPFGIHTRGFAPGFSLIVQEGACWIRTSDGVARYLTRGQSVTLPAGGVLEFASGPDAKTWPLTEVWDEDQFHELSDTPAAFHLKEFGGGGASCRLLGMAFELSEAAEEQILDSLPEAIVLTGESAMYRLAAAFSDHLLRSPEPGPGEMAQRTRIVEGMVISALRQHIEQANYQTGWMAALKHPKLRRALRAIHKQYNERWTVQTLAQACGMSRSSFAREFQRTIGRTPLNYLNDWRVRQALKRLRTTSAPLAATAYAVGFSSEQSLRRHIKRALGKTPRDVRRGTR